VQLEAEPWSEARLVAADDPESTALHRRIFPADPSRQP